MSIRSIRFALTALGAVSLMACGSSNPNTKKVGPDGDSTGATNPDGTPRDGTATLDPADGPAGQGRRTLTDDEFKVSDVAEKKAPVYLDGITREAQDAFREGVEAIGTEKRDYSKAEEHFKDASEKDPSFVEAFFNWGMVLERTGRKDAALGVYEAALAKNPDDVSANAYIAKIYLAKAREAKNLGKRDESAQLLNKSKSILDKLVALEPNNVAVNNAIALYYLSLDDVDTAERYVKEVLYAQPSNVTGLNTRGLINLKKGKLLIAKWIFENKVLREDPTSTEAHTNLGYTYIKLDQRPLAMRHFKKALDFEPNNMEVRQNIAAMLLEHLDYGGALDHYDKVLVAQPQNAGAMAGRCDALFGSSGSADDPKAAFPVAIQCYDLLLKEQRHRSELYKRIADTYWNKLQDLENAVKYYELYGKHANLAADAKKKNDQMVSTLKDIISKGGLKAMMEAPPMPEEGEEGMDDGTGEDGMDDGGEAPDPSDG